MRWIDSVCERFEIAWQEGWQPSIREFWQTAELPDPEASRDLLVELVMIDLEYRWPVKCAAGEPTNPPNPAHATPSPPVLRDYLAQFPELGSLESLPLTLVVQEYRARRRGGDRPDPSEYLATFGRPELAEALAQADGEPQSRASSPTKKGQASTNPMHEAAPHREPDRIGRYSVRAKLGAGRFGTVYRCHDELLDRDVAVKLFHDHAKHSPDDLDHILHEARAAARIDHASAVAVLDTGRTEDDRGFIVYEFVEGSTLKDRVESQAPSRQEAIGWVIEVADVLQSAHQRGIVHRDIKSANILIDAKGRARLTDFGIAKLDDRFYADDTGAIVGTFGYMSPEQAGGLSHWATPQSDIYSLGVVLYEVLLGRLPFSARDVEELLQQVLQRPVAPPRSMDETIPPAIDAICMKALAKRAEDRFASAADMAAALRSALAPRRRRPIAVATASVLAVAGIAALVGVLGRFHGSEGVSPPASFGAAQLQTVATPGGSDSAEEAPGQPSDFAVRVEVDQPDRVYKNGEVMSVRVVSERDGYLYLLYRSADGTVTCLFPNKVQQYNKVLANQAVSIPSPDSEFRIRIGSPYGQETLTAIVLPSPLPPGVWGVKSLTESDVTLLTEAGVKGAFVEVRRQPSRGEQRVEITTVESAPASPDGQRSGVDVAGQPAPSNR